MSKTAFLYPGQGSQEVGMGQALYQSFPTAKEIMDMAIKVTGMEDMLDIAFEGPMDKLTETSNLQPILTAVCLAATTVLREKGIEPAGAAGHSVSEYSALAAAGVLAPERAVALTAMRGDYMSRDAAMNPGAMAAVIADIDIVRTGIKDIGPGVQVANHNAAKQTVITGTKEAVAEAVAAFKAAKVKAIPLKVSGAWHSRLMSAATNDFAIRLAQTRWHTGRIPTYLNVTSKPETDGEKIAEIMAGQLSSPVRWYEIMVNMLADGFDTFIEIGPKTVLSGLMKKHLGKDSPVRVFQVDDPDKLEAVVSELAD